MSTMEKEIWINPEDPRGPNALSPVGRYTCKYILDDGSIEALQQENARLREELALHVEVYECHHCGGDPCVCPPEEVKG